VESESSELLAIVHAQHHVKHLQLVNITHIFKNPDPNLPHNLYEVMMKWDQGF